ncbi:MAG: hypothetical protein J2P19_27705 [Pseudonocardia sp.]|nr:hypothetical protein [Pseudonocardia sp.]
MRTTGDDPGGVPSGGHPTQSLRAGPAADTRGRDAPETDDSVAWSERSRIVLTPIAAPSILGLFGLAGATFLVASLLAGWWGGPTSIPIIAPFVFFFGGLAQLLAGMWSYRARDGVATAVHGTWGSFWMAWSALVGLVGLGLLPPNVLVSQAFGFWFIVMCVVTAFGALAALGESLGLLTVLILLAAGSGLLAAGLIGGFSAVVTAAGWVLVASAAAAFYTAGAMMLAGSFGGRTILPLGGYTTAANIPGRRATEPISYPTGMPGSKVGR